MLVYFASRFFELHDLQCRSLAPGERETLGTSGMLADEDCLPADYCHR